MQAQMCEGRIYYKRFYNLKLLVLVVIDILVSLKLSIRIPQTNMLKRLLLNRKEKKLVK